MRILSERRDAVSRSALITCALLVWCTSAFALNPGLDVSQYSHTSWRIRDGFPKGQIAAIAQTPDGYLWLGTEFGLVRFDGVRDVPWQGPSNQTLPSNNIRSLLVTRDGTLWIGTAKGLASWNSGKLTQYPQLGGQYMFGLLEDREGTLWAAGGAVPAGRLCAIRDNVECYGEDGKFGLAVFGLYEDSKGGLWVGTPTGLWRWKPGPPKFFPLAGEPDGIRGIGEDDDGTLLIGWHGALHRFVDGKTATFDLPTAIGQFRTNSLLRDRDGGMWIGTDRGLMHVHHGRTDVFTLADSLSGESVYTLFEDRERNIWVATIHGLDRFRDFAVTTLNVKQGLQSALVVSILADREGSIWFATAHGLNRWNNGELTVPDTGSVKRDGKLNGLAPNSLFQDDRGRIWVTTERGFGYLENDRFVSVSDSPGPVTSIAQDTGGNKWIAQEHLALFQVVGTRITQQIPWAWLGHDSPASTLTSDTARGGLWLGFVTGGVSYFVDNQIRESYAAADGLGQGRVNHLRFDQTGALWAATDGGLSRLKNGHVASLNTSNGLPCNTIHSVMEDDLHSFWLYTACGLVRIARSELDAWTTAVDQQKDPKPVIHVSVFDSSDGVRILVAAGHHSPQVAKTADGRLWFLPWDGVSVVDPNHLPFNRIPPPVHIERFTADRTTYDAPLVAAERLRLPPLIRDLQIDYTALSLVVPEKVLFRYKLENWDRDWQEAGNRRTAFYNNLPPGNYRFRVIACNNSGVWNEAGTFLDFNIAPAYYQTTWFRVLMVAVFLISLALIYQLRLRQVARQVRARMEERLEERERIARDLHDTLIQSVQGLILKFHAGVQQIPRDMPAYDTLEKTLDHADQVLAEGRDRVLNLRTPTIPFGDLPAAFKRLVEETPQSDHATFKTVVEGSLRELHPMVSEECYCIGREAIVNALTHSGGDKVEVEITYDSRQFRLRVRDNGRGFDPKILEDGGRPNHWGLPGMRERAEKIGAQLKLWSRPATGSEVELIVPGKTAYQAPHNKSKSSWLRRTSSSTRQ
jgi:ligand-binding sensor domain-containing protein/signal transduction histidine kinase